jgi:hypothetical protein
MIECILRHLFLQPEKFGRLKIMINKTEKAFSPIICGINGKYYRFMTI